MSYNPYIAQCSWLSGQVWFLINKMWYMRICFCSTYSIILTCGWIEISHNISKRNTILCGMRFIHDRHSIINSITYVVFFLHRFRLLVDFQNPNHSKPHHSVSLPYTKRGLAPLRPVGRWRLDSSSSERLETSFRWRFGVEKIWWAS